MRSLKGHGHWVNTLALSAEFALRTGAFDHTGAAPAEPAAAQAQALQRCALDPCRYPVLGSNCRAYSIYPAD